MVWVVVPGKVEPHLSEGAQLSVLAHVSAPGRLSETVRPSPGGLAEALCLQVEPRLDVLRSYELHWPCASPPEEQLSGEPPLVSRQHALSWQLPFG